MIAIQLTAGTDVTWEPCLDRIVRDNAPISRFATPEELADFFCVSLLAARQLLYGLNVLHGRRLTEGCGVINLHTTKRRRDRR